MGYELKLGSNPDSQRHLIQIHLLNSHLSLIDSHKSHIQGLICARSRQNRILDLSSFDWN